MSILFQAYTAFTDIVAALAGDVEIVGEERSQTETGHSTGIHAHTGSHLHPHISSSWPPFSQDPIIGVVQIHWTKCLH